MGEPLERERRSRRSGTRRKAWALEMGGGRFGPSERDVTGKQREAGGDERGKQRGDREASLQRTSRRQRGDEFAGDERTQTMNRRDGKQSNTGKA
eukprot:6176239-Pleurochrysis_carterae.AAC.1